MYMCPYQGGVREIEAHLEGVVPSPDDLKSMLTPSALRRRLVRLLSPDPFRESKESHRGGGGGQGARGGGEGGTSGSLYVYCQVREW